MSLCGFGLKTDLSFIENVLERYLMLKNKRSNIVVEFISIEKMTEDRVIKGEYLSDYEILMTRSIQNLVAAKVDFVVIPCNTVHIFLDAIRENISVPVISIIELTANYCFNKSYKKVGIIGTSMTTNKGMYHLSFSNKNIACFSPQSQEKIDQAVLNIVMGEKNQKTKEILHQAIDELLDKGAEQVILGCTDLFFEIDQKKYRGKLINTKEVLEDYVIEYLTIENEKNSTVRH